MRTKVAYRQVQLRNDEISTTDLLDSKQAPSSHLCGKADTLLVEVLDRLVATNLPTGSTVTIISKLSSVPKLHVERSSSETLRPPPLIYWAPSRIHAATSVAKQRPCWWRSCTGGHGPPNWLKRWSIFCYQAYQSCM